MFPLWSGNIKTTGWAQRLKIGGDIEKWRYWHQIKTNRHPPYKMLLHMEQ
jgi:hypothetical protein